MKRSPKGEISPPRQCLRLEIMNGSNPFESDRLRWLSPSRMRCEVWKRHSPSPQPSPLGRGRPRSQSSETVEGIHLIVAAYCNERRITIHPLPKGEGWGEGEDTNL